MKNCLKFINPNPSITQTAVWTVSCLGGLSNCTPPTVKACYVSSSTGKKSIETRGTGSVTVRSPIIDSVLGDTMSRYTLAVRLKDSPRSTRVLIIRTSVTGGIAHTGRKRARRTQLTWILAIIWMCLGSVLTSSTLWALTIVNTCLLYTSPSPRDKRQSRMPSSA